MCGAKRVVIHLFISLFAPSKTDMTHYSPAVSVCCFVIMSKLDFTVVFFGSCLFGWLELSVGGMTNSLCVMHHTVYRQVVRCWYLS